MKKISVVLPCLNEEDSIELCIDQVVKVFSDNDLEGEILIVDNGSTDRSVSIVERKISTEPLVRLINAPVKGYGSAYLEGFKSAKHEYIFMADSDGTYDFSDIPKFTNLLDQGFDLVVGNRFAFKMDQGVMPLHRKYLGNPFLSFLVRKIFSIKVKDIHCGARAFKNDSLRKLKLGSSGMELASEMIIKASKAGLKMTEIPTRYKKRIGESKLRSIRDGMRHLVCIVQHI